MKKENNFDVIDDSFPAIYQIDRIKKLRVLDEQFHIPYASRFEEGEFRGGKYMVETEVFSKGLICDCEARGI